MAAPPLARAWRAVPATGHSGRAARQRALCARTRRYRNMEYLEHQLDAYNSAQAQQARLARSARARARGGGTLPLPLAATCPPPIASALSCWLRAAVCHCRGFCPPARHALQRALLCFASGRGERAPAAPHPGAAAQGGAAHDSWAAMNADRTEKTLSGLGAEATAGLVGACLLRTAARLLAGLLATRHVPRGYCF